MENWITSINGSKLVLNLSLLFSKVCCVNFVLYKAGLSSINGWLITGYANLTSTYPLLGFLKWLECLEVGFREVVRGLVSPTPFTEGRVKPILINKNAWKELYIEGCFRIQVNYCLPSMRSVFSGVIDPNPNLNCENKSFLEKILIFRVLLTKPISLLRIAWPMTKL